jgi:hypothetical protein
MPNCQQTIFRHFLFHQSVLGAPPVSLGRTLARWFSYHADEELRKSAQAALAAVEQRHVSKALHLCLQLVELTIAKGLSTAVVVHDAHLLDSSSISLLRQIDGVRYEQAEHSKRRGPSDRFGRRWSDDHTTTDDVEAAPLSRSPSAEPTSPTPPNLGRWLAEIGF